MFGTHVPQRSFERLGLTIVGVSKYPLEESGLCVCLVSRRSPLVGVSSPWPAQTQHLPNPCILTPGHQLWSWPECALFFWAVMATRPDWVFSFA